MLKGVVGEGSMAHVAYGMLEGCAGSGVQGGWLRQVGGSRGKVAELTNFAKKCVDCIHHARELSHM